MSDKNKKTEPSKIKKTAGTIRVLHCLGRTGKVGKISNTDGRDLEPPPKKKK